MGKRVSSSHCTGSHSDGDRLDDLHEVKVQHKGQVGGHSRGATKKDLGGADRQLRKTRFARWFVLARVGSATLVRAT
jgi:hypothetical protein